MAVVLRLRRIGSPKRPFFRIVAADERTATSGRVLDELGWLDPKKDKDNFRIDLARVQYWTERGARISETVRSLIRKAQRSAPPAAPSTAATSGAAAQG